MTVRVTCTHDDCDMPEHTVPDRKAAEKIGSAHWKNKGHAIKYE